MDVAIIGAGVGGLALAVELQRRGIACRVYEAETSFEPSPRGGDLSETTAVRYLDSRGRLTGSSPGGVPEWVRWDDLREQSLNDLPPDTVRGGYRLVEARPGNEIVFANGERLRPEVLVGADGIRSRVRALVSPVLAEYTGRVCAEARNIRPAPDLLDLIGAGRADASGDDKDLVITREPDGGALAIAACFPAPEDFPTTTDMAEVAIHFADWDIRLHELLEESHLISINPKYRISSEAGRACADRPEGRAGAGSADREGGQAARGQGPSVTLIGAAAGTTSPAATLRAATELAAALAAYPDPKAAIDEFEKKISGG